jgi:pimeloyl-ACP methyl ester carboxylesterase
MGSIPVTLPIRIIRRVFWPEKVSLRAASDRSVSNGVGNRFRATTPNMGNRFPENDSRPLARVFPENDSRPAAKEPMRTCLPFPRWRRIALVGLALWIGSFCNTCPVAAWQPDRPVQDEEPAPWNIPAPTLGGLQTWTDELVFRDWRIQRQAMTGHYRLLDDQNHRRAWGTFEQCRTKLEELKQQLGLPPVRGTVVLVLHGLARSRNSMAPMVETLRQQDDWTVMNVSYASTRDALEGHARALARVVEHLDEEVTEIHFVAHSMGNLIVRRYLYGCDTGCDGRRPDPRLGRIVMLAPPNHGARMAEAFRHVGILESVMGKSTAQLAKDWENLSRTLATPTCEFGILAGGKNDDQGINRWLDGDDDFVVTVDETRLAGAHDFLVLPVYHRQIIGDPTARECTVRFLRYGYFVSSEQRQPLPPNTSVQP